MKKLITFCSFIVFINTISFSQGCLPQGIIFTTQTQIDSFAINNPGCTEIEGNVSISGSDIINLNGLSILTAIEGYIWIYENNALTSLTGLEGLTSIGPFLSIELNPNLVSLTGLENVTTVLNNISIASNPALTSLTGLEGLSFTGSLYIGYNESLTNLMGLEGLTTIGTDLSISGNPSLTSLTGLEGLTSIGGRLLLCDIDGGGNPSLTSLTGLEGLTSIGGDLTICHSDALTNLSGLENIEANTIQDLFIFFNGNLNTCEIQSICDYLASPNGTIGIHDNAPGCNSQQEVEDACEALDLNEIKFEDEFLIYPNPATNELFIESRNKVKVTGINIYNPIGLIVIKRKGIPERIDISTLNQGVYFVELVSNDIKIRGKLIVN